MRGVFQQPANALVQSSITLLRLLRIIMGPLNSFAEYPIYRATSDLNDSRGPRLLGVTCRQHRWYWLVLFAALAACGGQDSQQVRNTQLLGRRLAEIAGQANQAAPTAVDPDTRLDGAKAGPGLKLTSMYTLVNAEANGVDSTSFDAKLAPTIKRASCENPELRPLIDQSVLVVLEYRGIQGNPIGTVNVNRDTCLALK